MLKLSHKHLKNATKRNQSCCSPALQMHMIGCIGTQYRYSMWITHNSITFVSMCLTISSIDLYCFINSMALFGPIPVSWSNKPKISTNSTGKVSQILINGTSLPVLQLCDGLLLCRSPTLLQLLLVQTSLGWFPVRQAFLRIFLFNRSYRFLFYIHD